MLEIIYLEELYKNNKRILTELIRRLQADPSVRVDLSDLLEEVDR